MRRREVILSALGASLNLAAGGGCTNSGNRRIISDPREMDSEPLPEFRGASAWLNSPPLGRNQARGKVRFVQFWTYTCVNWRRTLPYVRAWHGRYKDHGLLTIGVHTPEFGFESRLRNVRRAVEELAIGYPIAVDSAHAIWNAFENQYWPALYVIDAQGCMRHRQFGEGRYGETERVIQQLLLEAGNAQVPSTLTSVSASGAELAADIHHLESPETYVGYGRSDSFASPERIQLDSVRKFTTPNNLGLNEWALAGDWAVGTESARVVRASAAATFRFHARDLNLVMGPGADGRQTRFRIRIDGAAPGPAHGGDVDENGEGVAQTPRMYQLLRQRESSADHSFEIECLDPGMELFDFTFG
jgi:hypothetical protein